MRVGAWWMSHDSEVHLERHVGLVLVHLEDGAAHIAARDVRERRQLDRRAAHVSAHSPLVTRRERHGVDLEEHLALPFGEDRPLAGVRHLQDIVRTAVLCDLHRLHRGHRGCETACRKKVDCEERDRDAGRRGAEAHVLRREIFRFVTHLDFRVVFFLRREGFDQFDQKGGKR